VKYCLFIIFIFVVSVSGQKESAAQPGGKLHRIEAQMQTHPDSLELYEEYCELSLKGKKTLDELYAFDSELNTIFAKMKDTIRDTIAMYETQIRICFKYSRFLFAKADTLIKALHTTLNKEELVKLYKINFAYYKKITDKSYQLCRKLTHVHTDSSVYSWCQSIIQYKKYRTFMENLKKNPAPLFHAVDINGRTVSLDMFRGRFVLIHFWSMYSQPSVLELNDLKKISITYSKQDLAVISINGDKLNNAIDEKILHNFINEMNLNWHHIADGNKRKIFNLYFVRNYPTLYLINRAGFIIYSENELRGKRLFSTFSKLAIRQSKH